MSAEIDPAKLKVVELRAELAARGLDTKGNKPVLVKRLKYALEKELEKELPDTSIADTSTEDFNTSQIEDSETSKEDEPKDVPITDEQSEAEKSPEKVKEDKIKKPSVTEVDDKSKSEESSETKVVKEIDKDTEEPEPKKPKIDSSPEKNMNEAIKKDKDDANIEEGVKSISEAKETAEEMAEHDEEMPEADTEGEVKNDIEKSTEVCIKTAEEDAGEACTEPKLAEAKETVKESPQRGDKRKRSPSPSRTQRRRSKSPIKEDEPAIDNNKVQLNWYDSDLHLQIDKESFLSGKPYHDGAFGYIWSGVRATHGADTGKVCYEVKITEELKWEDFIRQPDRGRKDRDRRDRGRDRPERRDKSWDKRKPGDKSSDRKDAKHKDKGREEKSEEKTKDSEKPDETQALKEEDENQIVTEDKETIESEVKTETKEEVKTETKDEVKTEAKEEVKTEVKEEVKTEEKQEEQTDKKQEVKQEEESEKAIDAADIKMESNDLDDSQKEEKSDEMMEVDKTEADAKIEKDDEAKEQKEKEKSQSKEKEVILPIPSHLIRIGWSSLNSGLQLGESKFSYGYESSGKFVNDKNFVEYGKPFSVGDVIGAYLEFTEETINIKYTINGEELPIAISIAKTDVPEENFSLFPHVLSRNYAFEVNLGGKDEPFFANPESLADYVYIDKFENKILGPTRPETRAECEVIMMCGLPASGKTHWVKEHVANNPDKRYTVIGNTQLLEKMTVNGNPLKNNLKGRWNVVLDKLSKCLNKLVEVAALRRRNYVIDQTNVFLSAQRRKMRSFEGFKRRAVIVVCGDEEQARRRTLQEAQDGKDVPNLAVYEMKANMSLPKVGDWLEEVTYVELDEQQAKTMVQKYNKEGKDNGFGPITQRRNYRDDRSRWQQNRRNDYRGGYRDRNYQPNRFDRGSKSRGGWQSRSNSWGRNERRDNRGPSSSRPPRDWRNNNRGSSQRHQDRGRDQSSRHGRDSYSRNRSQAGNRSQGNWQGGNGGNWGGYSGSQGNWQGQSGNWNPNYGNQGKWNYSGQSGGSGGYSQPNYNWNYQGQYMNWIGQDSGNWSK